MDTIFEELINFIIKDEQFNDIYNEFKIKEKIFLDFKELDNTIKIKILIKCYFIVLTVNIVKI